MITLGKCAEMSGSTTYRLNCSRTQTVEASKFSSFLAQESLTYKEVDFSECNLTNDTLKVVLDICKRCPKLRILKLFKNQLDDGATKRLSEMLLKTPELEELHLSHNLFTAEGVRCLVAAGETFGSDDKSQPLWLRLEQNSVESPDTVIDELEEEFSVCRRSDSVRCTVRTCVNKKKVHLPFFHLQRSPLRFKSRAELAAEAKAKQAPPVPTRSISRPEAGAPKAAKPCAWGQGRDANGSPVSQMSQSGYPTLGAKMPEAAKTLPEKPEALLKPVWKAGSRPSVVLDSFGQRRTMPDQLNGVDPTPFVCSLCHFVMIKPLITRCSHIFCSCCFRQWVQQEVDLHKSHNKTNGAPPVAVPQIRCPQPGCDQFLKKTDVEPADDGKTSGVQLFQRLRNNLTIRCVHHLDHHKFEFGQDASRLLEKGHIQVSGQSCCLRKDLKMPRGIALDLKEDRMYWAEDGTKMIRSATLDGDDLRDVIVKTEVQEAPRDVAIDPINQKIYWTALCCGIRRADLNGTNEEVVAKAEFASGVAVLDGQVYWADWMQGQILRHDVETGREDAIVTGLASPVDVALDSQQIYWSDVGVGRTQRASLEGGDVQFLNMSWAIMNTYGMAVDSDLGKLYMADFEKTGKFTGKSTDYSGRIIRTNLDGSYAEVLVSEPGMSMPYGVAVDAQRNQVYWTDRKAGRIQRLTLVCQSGVQDLGDVRSRTNSTVVQVPHGKVLHGSSTTVSCPAGYNGTVTFACNDNDMDDREELTLQCPSPLAGTVQFRCQDGVVLRHGNNCRKAHTCPAGHFLLGHARVEHTAMDHGVWIQNDCPQGFEGSYFLQCEDGSMIAKHNSSCRATCSSAGSLWVDEGRVEVSHGKIIEGGKVKVLCPTGSAGQGVDLSCEGGYINVTNGTCNRSFFCQPGYVASNNASVHHDKLDDLENIVLACPEGYSGSLDVSCNKGEVSILETASSQCHKICPAGVATLSDGIQIEYRDSLEHGQELELECPEHYTGRLPFVCVEGNMTCVECSCIPTEQVVAGRERNAGESALSSQSDLPIAAMAAGVTAAVLIILFGFGLLRHRTLKRRALAAAVAVAVGDIPAPPSSSCLDILPKTGAPFAKSLDVSRPGNRSRSGHSATSLPTGSTGKASATTYPARGDTDFLELVIDAALPLPLYWATRDGIHIFPDPNRIAEIQRLMTDAWRGCSDTWEMKFSRDRRLVHGSEAVPLGCRVANVLRVENHRAFARHLDVFFTCRFNVVAVGCILMRQAEDVNESYLFHGTNPESAQCIARDFFRVERAGSSAGSMFGPGIYLAENASKSDEYAKEGSGVYVGLCAMLLCRCAQGEVLTVSEAKDTREAVRAGYDSVCGDRLAAVGTFRISCSWSGAPSAYEEHMSRNCAVENYLMSESSVDTINSNEGTRSQYEAEPEPEDSVAAEPKVDSTMMNPNEGEVRIALYDYIPAEGEEAQIKISKNDFIKVFQNGAAKTLSQRRAGQLVFGCAGKQCKRKGMQDGFQLAIYNPCRAQSKTLAAFFEGELFLEWRSGGALGEGVGEGSVNPSAMVLNEWLEVSCRLFRSSHEGYDLVELLVFTAALDQATSLVANPRVVFRVAASFCTV
eukprot:s320_g36.t1